MCSSCTARDSDTLGKGSDRLEIAASSEESKSSFAIEHTCQRHSKIQPLSHSEQLSANQNGKGLMRLICVE